MSTEPNRNLAEAARAMAELAEQRQQGLDETEPQDPELPDEAEMDRQVEAFNWEQAAATEAYTSGDEAYVARYWGPPEPEDAEPEAGS